MDLIWLYCMLFAIASALYDAKRLAIVSVVFVGQGWFTLFLFDNPSDYVYYAGAIGSSLAAAMLLVFHIKYTLARSLFAICLSYATLHLIGLWIYESGAKPDIYNHACKALLALQTLRMIWPTRADRLELRGLDYHNLVSLGHNRGSENIQGKTR